MRKHTLEIFSFSMITLLLLCSCGHNQQSDTNEVITSYIPATIVPPEEIEPPIITTLQGPDVMPPGEPIKHIKLKHKSPQLIQKDFEFIQTAKIKLSPGQSEYPPSVPLHSEPAFANPPQYGVNASDWKTVKGNYLHLTEKEGLEMDNTNGLFQDQKGNIWGSTRWGGAWKYDGYQFAHYRQASGLEDYSVVNLFFDRDGDIWFGMSFGVAKFDGSHFTHYTGEGEVSKNKPTKFAEDEYGNIWIGSMDGLYRLDKQQNTITHFTKENGLLDDEVNAIHYDDSGQLWIAYNQLGLSQLIVEKTPSGYHYQFSNYKANDVVQFNYVQCLYENKKGQFFVGTDRGVIQIYPNESGSNMPIKGSRYVDLNATNGSVFVHAITEDHLGRLWVGANYYLMQLKFDENGTLDQAYTFKEEDGLLSNAVFGLVFDQENYLWASHPIIGITKIDLNQTFRSISDDYGIHGYVIGGFEDRWQNVWFSLHERGIFCLKKSKDGKTEYLLEYNREQNITLEYIDDMLMDDKGHIWVGGINAVEPGVNIFKLELTDEGNLGSIQRYTKQSGLKMNRISDLLADDDGAIWIAENTLSSSDKILKSTGGGVYKLHGNQLWYYGKDQGLLAPDTYSMCPDPQGNFWFNSTFFGLTKFEPSTKNRPENWIHYEFGNTSFDIISHHTDGIWKSANGALYHISSEVETPTQEIKQLSMNAYEKGQIPHRSIMRDFEDNLWVGQKQGIVRIRSNEMRNRTEVKRVYDSYTKLDGFNGDFSTNLFQTIDSTIYLSVTDHFLSFRPKDLTKKSKDKEVTLHNVLLFDEDIKWEKDKSIVLKTQKVISDYSFEQLSKWTNVPQKLSLSYQDNYIGFEYNAVEVSRPHKVEYRHFLEGYEKRWNGASKDRKISYPNLPHGKFTLQISARIDGGEWGTPLKYNFQIRPPWWFSWWAYGLYVLIGVTAVYAFYQFQLSRNLEKAEADRLKELDAVKTRLYTNITHEFRTPLTVISGMTDQIEENPKEWFSEGLSMIRRNSNRLLQLVNQMLDLNKLESGKISLKNQQSDILPYLKYLVESIHSYAKGKNIKVHFIAEEENIVMDYDPENVQKVFMNLLSNALKFTPDEGDVYVSVRRKSSNRKENGKASMLQISVRDTGVGIPESQLPFIFDRFYQVDDSTTRHGEGSGIGLALVKELVKLMKGEITVKSKLGKETVFTVLLPIHNSEKEVAPPIYPSPVAGKLSPGFENTNTQVLLEQVENGIILDGSKPRVLIIEDNSDVVAYIASCLKDDYAILVGNNGQEGIDIAIEHTPDIIISDVMMPVKDGFEVTKTLKHDERTSHIPIIMLTAKADLDSKIEGLEKGADAYLAKPFHKEELLVRIKKLLELRKSLQKHYLSLAGSSHQEVPDSLVVDQFVIKLKEVVESHLSDFNFTVELLGKEVAMSSSQLHRKVTALTGLSPNKFIRHIKLSRAKTLLLESEAPINAVAYESGFGDPSYFGRVFKKEFGMTPIEWRDHT